MAEMVFSFLSGAWSFPSHCLPWPALRNDEALPGSQAEKPPECVQEPEEGKGEKGKKGPGGTGEQWEVCVLELRTSPPRPRLAQAPPGPPGG